MEKNQFKLTNSSVLSKNDPATYILSEELRNAVNVALMLNQPLILTGEPGTGKTQLAYKLAYELHKQTRGDFAELPLEFHTKTTTTAQDLFYQYDAIRHFHDSNVAKKAEVNDASPYISLHALGTAIAKTNADYLKSKDSLIPNEKEAGSSVVLIDEIDKAPRDFPNDILNEIEQFRFRIKEMQKEIVKSSDKRILVIMTSNSEKSLPEPFLRRCVFYHIPFPNANQLMEIASQKIAGIKKIDEKKITASIAHFETVREKVHKKMPATSELLSWLQVLELSEFYKDPVNFNDLSSQQKDILTFSYSILIKDKDDLAMFQ